jgi:hypothetical protein
MGDVLLAQQRLAFVPAAFEGQSADVAPVDMDQVEDEIRQPVARRARERILQRLEARDAARIDDGDLAVE